jgi:NADH-quinone oxidoreductase subunit M
MSWLLTILVFLPSVGALAVMLAPQGVVKWVATGFSAVTFLLSLWLYLGPQLHMGFLGPLNNTTSFGDVMHPAWLDSAPWIHFAIGSFQLNIQYRLGADGLSIFMLILNALLSFLAIIGSWNISMRTREYMALILILETGVMGVFCAFDLYLFWLFWEVELIPMFLLIAIWGGKNRSYAAWKFVLYTIFGSAFMLAGIILLYFNLGGQNGGVYSATFDYLASHHVSGTLVAGGLAISAQLLIFLLLYLGFAIKIPMIPFHTWLPDAHTEAPTAVSVLLAGILLKMGAYGLIRICIDFAPDGAHQFALPLAIFGAINILYGAGCSLVQQDMKKMIAYSSVSHMGFVILGVAAAVGPGATNMAFKEAALTGAAIQMFTHGTITGMLFFCVGVVYDRAHTRDINVFGGLQARMPRLTWVFTFAALASLGLPGLSGFVAEYIIYTNSYAVFPAQTIIAASAMILTAGYLLWMLKRSFYGPLNPHWSTISDATILEMTPLVILGALVVFVGIFPGAMIDLLRPSLHQIIQTVGGTATGLHP